MNSTQDTSLVQRLISFLKKPSALDHKADAHNPYDDYESREDPGPAREARPPSLRHRLIDGKGYSPNSASRLDSLVMRIAQQFHARGAYVIRYDSNDEMHYLTGRNANGDYIDPAQADPDRRALFLVLDSGESQVFVHHDQHGPVAVLCGPLWTDTNEIIGVLYLDNPARSTMRRGIFDVFCEQVARMVASGVH